MTATTDHRHHHHLRLAVPPRTTTITKPYPYPFNATPTPSSSSTPSKRRLSSTSSSSYVSLVLLLLSLHSLYTLLLSSFSLFPFTFLVFLLSTFLVFLLPDPHKPLNKALFFSASLLRPLAAKSLLLALVFLLRFHSLRSIGAAATVLLDFCGSLAAKSLFDRAIHGQSRRRRARGFAALAGAVLLQGFGWHRVGCSLFDARNVVGEREVGDCVRVLPMLFPVLSGFLGYLERSPANWGSLRPLGKKKVGLFSLAFATVWLFFPAFLSFMLVEEGNGRETSISSLAWPLVNTVVFGVVLGKNNGDERSVPNSKDVEREFLFTFFCTLVLELFYFPRFSLPGFFVCGFLMWIAVKQLASSSFGYIELGNADPSESLYSMIRNPIRHILSERKSRKIALFLLINTAYMVVEFVAGFMSNSLGLISDACHMLFDCAALAIGLYASYISRLPANSQFNYGWGRFEVLSGYVNAVFLVLVGALIVLESLERILDPQEISTDSLLSVSIGGFLVNIVGLVFFHEEHHHAHGGGGSCSHSHLHNHAHVGGGSCSHSHSHHHSHDHVVHDQATNMNHHSSRLVIHQGSVRDSCSGTDHHCSEHDHHHHNQSENSKDSSNHICHTHHHDHSDHSHDVDNHVERKGKEEELVHHIHESSLSSPHSHCHLNHTCDKDCDDGEPVALQGPLNISIMPNGDHSHSSNHGKVSTNGKLNEHRKHHHIDHNMEGIFLHVLADTMGSVGVIFSTLLIKYKGWLASDPACSIFISVMIISSVLPLLRNSAEILLQRVPKAHEKDLTIALDDITRINGVSSVQNMKSWSFTNAEVIGTLHVHVSTGNDKDSVKKQVSDILHDVGIKDLSIQVEYLKK